MQKNTFLILAVGIFPASIVSVVFSSLKNSGVVSPIISKLSDSSQKLNLSPTPFPFQEMTIPYLRNKTYSSSLYELDRINETQNFTSYITSYDSDGLKINGLLTIPKGEKPSSGWPAIIFIHGYIPPTLYRTQQNYASHVTYLARNGFVVFKIDLRGHDESEGEPGGAYYSADYIIDVLNARAALQKSDFVNPDKIGLWGHSMAGNVVLRSLASQPEIPAVVIWAGAVYSYEDFQKYRLNGNSYRPPSTSTQGQGRRQQLFDTYGEFNVQNDFWKQVAATNYLSDIKGAIQLHHAINDTVVNIGYSKDLNNILDQTSIPHELYEYSTGGHNLTGNSFNQAMQRTIEFFQKYLE